jgi:hypothetical protein
MFEERSEPHAKLLGNDEHHLRCRFSDRPSTPRERRLHRELGHHQCRREALRQKLLWVPSDGCTLVFELV